jgi:plastocyanin
MKFSLASALFAASALVGIANAVTMHVITVGKGGKLEFCPNQITAATGDLVQFQFYPKVIIA